MSTRREGSVEKALVEKWQGVVGEWGPPTYAIPPKAPRRTRAPKKEKTRWVTVNGRREPIDPTGRKGRLTCEEEVAVRHLRLSRVELLAGERVELLTRLSWLLKSLRRNEGELWEARRKGEPLPPNASPS